MVNWWLIDGNYDGNYDGNDDGNWWLLAIGYSPPSPPLTHA